MERFGDTVSSPSLASPSSTPSRSPSPSPSCIKGRASILCKNTFTHTTRYYLTLLLLSTSVKFYIPKTTTYLQLFTFLLPLGHVYSFLFTFSPTVWLSSTEHFYSSSSLNHTTTNTKNKQNGTKENIVADTLSRPSTSPPDYSSPPPPLPLSQYKIFTIRLVWIRGQQSKNTKKKGERFSHPPARMSPSHLPNPSWPGIKLLPAR